METNVGKSLTTIIQVLNTGEGDVEIKFNSKSLKEYEDALAMLELMKRRGYAICVDMGDGSWQRAEDINLRDGMYVLRAIDPVEIVPKITDRDDSTGSVTIETPVEEVEKAVGTIYRGRGRTKKIEKPIAGTRAVAVARSAGG